MKKGLTNFRKNIIEDTVKRESLHANYSHKEIFELCQRVITLRESSTATPEEFEEIFKTFFSNFVKEKEDKTRERLKKFYERVDQETDEKREQYAKENWIFEDELFIKILPEKWVYFTYRDWPSEERLLISAIEEAWNLDETTNEGYLAMKQLFPILVLPPGKTLDDIGKEEFLKIVSEKYNEWKNALPKEETINKEM